MKYILVLEDEEMVRETTVEILEALGYAPVAGETGAEAIDAFRKLHAENKTVHLAMLDLNVPGGLSGKDTFLELRKIDPEIKAILTTGLNPDFDDKEMLKLGFAKVLTKPFQIKDLAEVLKNI